MKKAKMNLIIFTSEDVIATSYVTISGLSKNKTNDNAITWYDIDPSKYNYYGTGNAAAGFVNSYNQANKGTKITYTFYNQKGEGQDFRQLMSNSKTTAASYDGTYQYNANGDKGAGFYQTSNQ